MAVSRLFRALAKLGPYVVIRHDQSLLKTFPYIRIDRKKVRAGLALPRPERTIPGMLLRGFQKSAIEEIARQAFASVNRTRTASVVTGSTLRIRL